ncbi:MAG: hypothetical protein WB870_00895 [Gallionellaceae bacterium]
MNTRILAPVLFSFFLACSGSAFAADGKITISAPANDATVTPNDDVEITYEAVLGPNGNHLHLYLDDKRIDVLHQLKGKADVGMIPAGSHKICLTENTASHAPTGVETCINVTSK